MPYYSVGAAATQVFSPNTSNSGAATLSIYNEDRSQTVYIGIGGVTPTNGTPLLPGNKLRLPNVTANVYACSNWSSGAALFTLTTAVTAGSGTLIGGATINAVLPVGTVFALGPSVNQSGQEVLTVATSASTTSLTTTLNTLYDHAASSVCYTPSYTPPVIRVEAGTTLRVGLGSVPA
jgi:hypothetical protein